MRRTMLMLAALAIAWTPVAARPPKVGETAPDFTIRLADKSTVTLADLKGQVVLLNFWATWCVPCRTELPTLDTYYKLMAGHGMKAYAITTETSIPTTHPVMKKLASMMTMPMVKGIKGPYAPIGGFVPSNFIIDRAGVVRYAKSGALDLDDLNREFVPLLNEPTPKP